LSWIVSTGIDQSDRSAPMALEDRGFSGRVLQLRQTPWNSPDNFMDLNTSVAKDALHALGAAALSWATASCDSAPMISVSQHNE
jgi:hypothetical protein